MSNKKTSLLLSLPTPPGITDDKTIDLDHQWAAPIRRSILKGGPPGTWRYTFTKDLTAVPRMLGAFVYTTAKRTLFCPGFKVLIVPINSDGKDGERTEVDHITLEPRKPDGSWSSHVATRKDGIDGPRGLQQNSVEESGFMFAWFSLIIPNFDVLEVLPKRIVIPHDVPSADLPVRPKRTLGNYLEPPANIQFAENLIEGSCYYQLDVWITDKMDWQKNLSATAINYVTQKSSKPIEDKEWKGQTDFDLLKGQCGIRILTSIRPGIAEYPCILLSQFSKGEALLV